MRVDVQHKILSVKYSTWILILIFIAHIFLRFYQFEQRNQFGWDQVDNAWAAKNIIVDHKFPLVGMVAKQNTGFFIGPLYYYFVALFYWLFNLDPIASVFIAGITSIFSFFVLFFITKRLFSIGVATIAVFIYTFSSFAINADRVQWPINFIPPISLMVFYFLYKVCMRETKYIVPLAATIGFSFHLNFTSIFFPIIIIFALPLFSYNMQLLKYSLVALPVFLLFLIPNFIYELINKGSSSRNLADYINSYYHGFHLQRLLQIIGDAFIEFEEILTFKILKPLKYIILPVFIIFFFVKNQNRKTFVLIYLMILWIIIPWIVFSVYKGEISNYYFSPIRPIVFITIAFISAKLLESKYAFLKVLILFLGIIYLTFNIMITSVPFYRPLAYYKKEVQRAILAEKVIEFNQYTPEPYIYYFYKRNEFFQKH